ncbi:hypothetical protein [Robiginitalea sp. SC105]|uniref:hypothetical protein n=1 Tax=Robiginitalea sp. SC105 TaxID=2762332 RepID=UPI001639B060|nr:hypothetical protein [Robiginitalea sp. SC105]MBC2838075.1 hypothetical protein [Robiginitalea sp. SC105]
MSVDLINRVFTLLSCMVILSTRAQLPPEPRPHVPGVAYDSVIIQWPKSEWFGKAQVTLENFGTARYRSGITSSSNKVWVNGRKELMQKMGFRVELQDSSQTKFKIQGKKYWTSGYWQEDGGGSQILGEILNLPEMPVTSETYVGDEVDLELRDAEIRHSLHPDEIWNFHLKRNPSSGAIRNELDAYISNGSRIIVIKGPTYSAFTGGNGSTESSYYAFFEHEILIAWASRSEPLVYFPNRTPLFTRSLLLTVILAMSL